nr:PREDICTED: zinc finger protein 79-like [Balearica regulorum gibbericeps]
MYQRDLLGSRQDDSIHLEKAFEGLHSILLHPEDAIGDNHSGYGECEEIISQTSNLQQCEAPQTEKPHKCPKCNKDFRWCSDVIKHQRTHTGEKLITCSECRKNFRVSFHLISHRRMHTGERPYPYLKCRKSFI